eukprot:TRINITY_DN8595_c0_g1_i4.p4 TRINITY_DN8595_c0_g1~~TRINITY_DN8595_c0_g1_i4.p4  ORF type:complete len:109 (-),score=10.79 TRINITY_DN8595_c0_g1_i4:204-530(-)
MRDGMQEFQVHSQSIGFIESQQLYESYCCSLRILLWNLEGRQELHGDWSWHRSRHLFGVWYQNSCWCYVTIIVAHKKKKKKKNITEKARICDLCYTHSGDCGAIMAKS